MRTGRGTALNVLLAAAVLVSVVPLSQPVRAVSTTLVINEIDYDQPSTDSAEFIELMNVSTAVVDLDDYTVELVNGNAGGAVVYQTIQLPSVSLPAGDYFVLCADAAATPNCDLDVSPDTNLIQNGAPDAVGLRQGGVLVDAVSYEGDTGAPYTEGSGMGLEDPALGAASISRCPDGADTDVNNVDFAMGSRPLTPGAANDCPNPPAAFLIREIQGAAHRSPLEGQAVATQGIVTAVRPNGFHLQDPSPDSDDATSEAIFVFTSSPPTVSVGDEVGVDGVATEFRPGGNGSANLTTTEITAPVISVLSTGNNLPVPIVIGTGGRVPPSTIIEDDASGDVETSGVFEPATDGIDFYESLEAMRVQVNGAIVVGPSSEFGEIPIVGDMGANAGVLTARGGIVIRSMDFNPERIILDDVILPTPIVDVGDSFADPIVGVMDYSFGNFKLLPTSLPAAASGGLAREATALPAAHQLAVATFNVENLDPGDGAAKFDELADLIVNNLQSADIIALEEVQDNNGAIDDAVVDATTTFNLLITAIQSAGGPTYDFRQIDPVDDQDGGEPGGNIRVGFLFRTDRGLAFVDRPGGDSTTPTTVVNGPFGPELSFSPGRIDPANVAFNNSRKPLAGEFTFNGDKVFLIANHFNSKGGDQPLFGHFQPPDLVTEDQRTAQAEVVNDFVDAILALDPGTNVVVLGDFNDFEFSVPLAALKGGVLNDLIETLPQNERYTYVFEGNSQALDHILVGASLLNRPFEYDVVHVNSEFAVQASDHEPQVARLCADATPPSLVVSATPNVLRPPNHKYRTVNAAASAADNADPEPTVALVSVTSNEPDNAPGNHDGNTINDIVILNDFSFRLRAERSELGSGRVYTITYQATDACGNATLASATVRVPLN
jgi:predicted extracellular nuclease